jgi:predicted 2-oxoglutarate/Fe(II)-dependent dioxygenase YbiX
VIVPGRPFFIDDFLDPATCRRLRRIMDRGDTEPAEILEDTIALDVEVRRVATVDVAPAVVTDIERRLDGVRDRVAGHFGLTLTAREGVSFLRYSPGDFYLPHVDRAEVEVWPAAARRQLAVVIFLNSSVPHPDLGEFAGGELCLIDARVDVVPREGMLVAFDAGMLHEVLPVREGTRDVIVDWYS